MSHNASTSISMQSVADPLEVTLQQDVSDTTNLDKTRRLNELKKDFTGSRDANATAEALTYVLRCLETSQESHAKHLYLLAAGVLLQIISNASPKHIPASAVEAVYVHLARPSISQKNSSATTLAQLRLLDVTFTKSHKTPPKGVLQDIMTCLKQCMCLGRASQLSRERSQPHDRLTVSNTMSTFMLPVAPTTSRARKAVRKRGSNSSFSSARSDTSDSESSVSANQAVDQATIRFEALKCLASLAQIDSKAIHPYWPMLFDTSGPSLFTIMQADPALSVRDMAVQACCRMLNRSKGYLGLSKESTTKSAFTSLSETLANIAARLNQIVVEVLARREFLSLPPASKEHWLDLTDAVLANTPYEQLCRISLAPLIHVLLGLCNSEDITSASSGLPVLSRAVDISASSENLRKTTSEVISNGTSATLAEVDTAPASKHWAILAALASRVSDDERSLPRACELIKSSFPASNSESRLHHVNILRKASIHSASEGLLHPVKATEMVLRHVEENLSDTVFTVELARLVGQNAQHLSWDNKVLVDKVTWLVASLTSHQNKNNRAAAYSCIAALLQSDAVLKDEQLSQNLLDSLVRQASDDPAQGGKAEAIRCLADICDSLKVLKTHAQSVSSIYRVAASAAGSAGGSRDVETIRTSAIRILGIVLSSDILPDDHQQRSGISILLAMLTDSSAKIQWNAATALKRILPNATHTLTQDLVIVSILKALLHSENVKVCSSLISVLDLAINLGAHEGIRDTLQQVKQKLAIKDDLPFEEFARAEQTQIAVQGLLDRISEQAPSAANSL